MTISFQLLFALMVCAGTSIPVAHSQSPVAPPPMPEGPRYIVTYLEVMPTAKADAIKLVRQFRDATRKEAGNLRAETLQRIGPMHHFVLLEAWNNQAAADAHFKATGTVKFRDKIKAIQNAPIDDRVSGSSAATTTGRGARPAPDFTARTRAGVVVHIAAMRPSGATDLSQRAAGCSAMSSPKPITSCLLTSSSRSGWPRLLT